MFCWGLNNDGQLGLGDKIDRALPVEVTRPGGMSWTDVATGFRHTCGLAGGRLYCGGRDDEGQLGNGAAGNADTPQAILPGMNWLSVGSGTSYSCAIDTTNARHCWGSNFMGTLGGGAGIGAMVNTPTLMSPGMGPTSWLRVVGGDYFGCGIGAGANAGEVWCWGNNDTYQLGTGDMMGRSRPRRPHASGQTTWGRS